jgi:hypothetical protein
LFLTAATVPLAVRAQPGKLPIDMPARLTPRSNSASSSGCDRHDGAWAAAPTLDIRHYHSSIFGSTDMIIGGRRSL